MKCEKKINRTGDRHGKRREECKTLERMEKI